jgi:hypothetical protein
VTLVPLVASGVRMGSGKAAVSSPSRAARSCTTVRRTRRFVVRPDSPTNPSSQSSVRAGWRPAAGWLWLASIVYAPWAYGSTRPWTIQILNVLIFTSLGIWLAGAAIHRTRPRVPLMLFTAVLLLLLQGWWMTLNAGFSYDAAFHPQPRPRWSAALPGAVDFAVAQPTMVGLTAMLGALCLACDLGRDRTWRRRLWFTLALTGVSIVILGLAQKVTHAPGIFWRPEGHASTFFGPYRYHANAGAFINLVWPLIAAFLVRSLQRIDPIRIKAFWATCFVLSIAGALANTSRASGLITIIMLSGWAGWTGWRLIKRRSELAQAGSAIAVTLLLLTSLGIYVQSRLSRQGARFSTVTGKGFRPRTIDLGRWRYLTTAIFLAYFLAIVVLVVFAAGCALGVAAMVPSWWHHRRQALRSPSGAPASATKPDCQTG